MIHNYQKKKLKNFLNIFFVYFLFFFHLLRKIGVFYFCSLLTFSNILLLLEFLEKKKFKKLKKVFKTFLMFEFKIHAKKACTFKNYTVKDRIFKKYAKKGNNAKQKGPKL